MLDFDDDTHFCDPPSRPKEPPNARGWPDRKQLVNPRKIPLNPAQQKMLINILQELRRFFVIKPAERRTQKQLPYQIL